jgi:aminoglycoside phosphotransferase family enzyme
MGVDAKTQRAGRLVEALTRADAYDHPTRAIRIVETHCAWVLSTGDYAYKIKKPVDFGFLNFSTLEKRRFYCKEEVHLNRRFAPAIYLDVVAITGQFAIFLPTKFPEERKKNICASICWSDPA